MSNPGIMLTKLGRELLAKGLTGKEIHFSKVAYGSGIFDYETENVFNLSELREWKMDLPIVGKIIEGNGIVGIKALLNNFELVEGFAAREVGIYATDPDTGEEILYAYRNAGDEYTYIPANTGPVHKNTTMCYRIEIQDAPNVTFNINAAFAYAAQKDFEEHIQSKHPHPNIPNFYDDIIQTSSFWATDEDSNLHKINLRNTKEVLLGEVNKNVSQNESKIYDLTELTKAQNDLGTDTNLLVLEDFKKPLTVDDLKIRVTSCATGNNLIGLENLDGLKVGLYYKISDGISEELIKISDIVFNDGGYHIKITRNLEKNYNTKNIFLCKSTAQIKNVADLSEGGEKTLSYKGRETFLGISANVSRTKILETSSKNFDLFNVSGDGILTQDGFFTLQN